MKTLKYYSDCCGNIELPYNSSCSCCCVDEFDAEYWVFNLRINIDLIGKVQKYVINIFKKYCLDWKRIGYDYFDPDKVDEEEMKEICDANNWWFLEDGTYYAA